MKKKPKNLRQVNALTIIIFVCAIFWLMPLVLIFINSFKPYNDMLQDFLALPKSWSLKMYVETWTKFGFPSLIFNTLLYTFGAFWGMYKPATLVSIALSSYVIFIVTSLADTPFVYLARMIHDKTDK